MHIHIDQGVSFSKLAKNIKIQKLGKLLLPHFGCILAHCAACLIPNHSTLRTCRIVQRITGNMEVNRANHGKHGAWHT